ncbi:MAG: hypothetical protein ACRYGK_00635 [Janthinobacterium lividum]
MPKLPPLNNLLKNVASLGAMAAAEPTGRARSAASGIIKMLPHHAKLQSRMHGFMPGASKAGLASLGSRLAKSAAKSNLAAAPAMQGAAPEHLAANDLAGRFGDFTNHFSARFKELDGVVDKINKLCNRYDPAHPSDLASTATDSVLKMLLKTVEDNAHPGVVNALNLLDGTAAPGSPQAERERRRMLKGGTGDVDGGDDNDNAPEFGADDTNNDGVIDGQEWAEHAAEADDNLSTASSASHHDDHTFAHVPAARTPSTPSVVSATSDASLLPSDLASSTGAPAAPAASDPVATHKAMLAARANARASQSTPSLTAANLAKHTAQSSLPGSGASSQAGPKTPSASTLDANDRVIALDDNDSGPVQPGPGGVK